MNSELRLLSIRDGKLSQYPTDFMREIFLTYVHEVKEQSQIFVHRNTNMMYYTYICRLSRNHNDFFGISVTFNSVCIKDIDRLFDIFEKTLGNIVSKAVLLDMNANEEMYFKSDFVNTQTEVKRIKDFMDALFDKYKVSFEPLEALNYGISNKEVAIVSLEKDSPKQIDFMLRNYCNVRIFKQYIASSVIDGLRSEIKELKDKRKKLSSELTNLTAQKHKSLTEIKGAEKELERLRKRRNMYICSIAFLFVLLIAGTFWFYQANKDSISTMKRMENREQTNKRTIAQNNETISSQKNTISQKKEKIDELQKALIMARDSIRDLKNYGNRYRNEHQDLESRYSSLSNKYPIKITDIEIANVYYNGDIETNYGQTIYSGNSMYLQPRIRYIGTQNKYITLKVKLYDSNGSLRTGTSSPSGYSYQGSYNIYSGSNSITLSGWGNEKKGNWSAGQYRVEIWYDDVCLGAKSFRIY